MVRHLLRDVNHPYPLCLVVRIRLQQLGRSRAETETRHLSIDIAFYGFWGGSWGAFGGTHEGHVTKCAAAALDAVGFHASAGGGRGGGSGVGDVQMLEWWLTRIGGVRDGDYIPMGPEMFTKNGVVGLANLPALEVEVDHRR